jgi:hypothetical protein
MIRVVAKLNLIFLLSESRNFRNDGWTQDGFKKKYKDALLEYIKGYVELTELERH